MKNVLLGTAFILTSLSFGSIAYACDMHGGGGFGFGMKNANWQSYSPRASTIDPAFADVDGMTPMGADIVPQEKAKPSFANAAGLAAMKAKSRMAKKNQDKPSEGSKKALVKEVALNADR